MDAGGPPRHGRHRDDAPRHRGDRLFRAVGGLPALHQPHHQRAGRRAGRALRPRARRARTAPARRQRPAVPRPRPGGDARPRRHRPREPGHARPAEGPRHPRVAEVRHGPVRPHQPLRRRLRRGSEPGAGPHRPLGLRRGLRPRPGQGPAQGAARIPGRAGAQDLRPRPPRPRRHGDAAGLHRCLHPEGAPEPRPGGGEGAPGHARMDRAAERRSAGGAGRYGLFGALHQAVFGTADDAGRGRPRPGQDRLRPAAGGGVRCPLRRLLAPRRRRRRGQGHRAGARGRDHELLPHRRAQHAQAHRARPPADPVRGGQRDAAPRPPDAGGPRAFRRPAPVRRGAGRAHRRAPLSPLPRAGIAPRAVPLQQRKGRAA